jgi:subfamily B ATP-binding cassette protein MsbA
MSVLASPWQTYKRLLGFARPYRVLLLMALAGMLIEAAAGMGFLALMSPITDNLVNPEDINPWMPLAIIGLFLLRGVAGCAGPAGAGAGQVSAASRPAL